MAQLGPLLTGGVTVLAAISALVLMVTRRDSDLPVKLLGSLLVLAICFAAQNAAVYGVGVFVVATLVTELQFLEKIAALIWNRKEYWDYLTKASRGEVEKKIAAEAKEIAAANAQPAVLEPATSEVKRLPTATRPALSGLHFHRQVLKAIEEQRPIPFSDIQTDVKVGVQGRQFFVDAILKTSSEVFVVEIKAGYSPKLLNSAILQLKSCIDAAGPLILGQRYVAYPIRGVVIIPTDAQAPLQEETVAVLQFDPQTKAFVNAEQVWRYLQVSE